MTSDLVSGGMPILCSGSFRQVHVRLLTNLHIICVFVVKLCMSAQKS